MVAFGYLVILVGLILVVAGELRLLALAHRTGCFWFMGCLLVPFCDLAFSIAHSKLALRPFATAIGGWLLLGVGLLILDLRW